MKRPIHPLILTCQDLIRHQHRLPRKGLVSDGAMLRFRMDDTISAELSAASAQYFVKSGSGGIEGQHEGISAEQSAAIIARFTDESTEDFFANAALDRSFEGAGTVKPVMPEAFITMEWHLPNLMTWEKRRQNMTHLRPAIANFKEGSSSHRALPGDVDQLEDVQIFLYYPAVSQHQKLASRHLVQDEIKLWAQALKIDQPIQKPIWADISGPV